MTPFYIGLYERRLEDFTEEQFNFRAVFMMNTVVVSPTI